LKPRPRKACGISLVSRRDCCLRVCLSIGTRCSAKLASGDGRTAAAVRVGPGSSTGAALSRSRSDSGRVLSRTVAIEAPAVERDDAPSAVVLAVGGPLPASVTATKPGCSSSASARHCARSPGHELSLVRPRRIESFEHEPPAELPVQHVVDRAQRAGPQSRHDLVRRAGYDASLAELTRFHGASAGACRARGGHMRSQAAATENRRSSPKAGASS
jgi:hypothetical protein